MSEVSATMALLQPILQLSVLQKKLGSYMTLTSPRNLLPVGAQQSEKAAPPEVYF